MVKNPPVNAGDAGNLSSILGSRRFLVGNGNLLQYSCVENFMNREAWRATVQGVARSWIRLNTHTHVHTHTSHVHKHPLCYSSLSWHYLSYRHEVIVSHPQPNKILALIRAHSIFLAPEPPFNVQHLHLTHSIHQTFHMLIGLNQLPLCLKMSHLLRKRILLNLLGELMLGSLFPSLFK